MLHRLLVALFVCSLTGALSGWAFAGSNACPGGYSPRFVISGDVRKSATYDEHRLGVLQHSFENVTFLTGTGTQSGLYGGVLLWDLLNSAGIKTYPNRDGDVEVTGTDCYQVVLALGEIDPGFGGEQVLVADSDNGAPLGTDTGFARLIVPGDKFGGRDGFWITTIKVLSSPPPGSP
jgi:hypothetical protein